MVKIIKTLLIVAAAIALVVFAAPIAAAIGPALGLATAGLTTAIVGIGLSLGLQAVMSLFQKTPKMSGQSLQQGYLNPDPTAVRKIIFGQTAGASDSRFKETYGKNGDRTSYVLALASHKLTTIQSVSMDGTTVWQNGQGLVSSKYRDGLDEVDPRLVGIKGQGRSVGTGTFWNTTSTFTGCSYSVITFRNDATKVWTSGLPAKIIHHVEGCPVYDPRADDTAGGSGSMRAGDQSTWNYWSGGVAVGRNPALCLLTYLIGWRIEGKLAWGMGLPLDAIDLESFVAQANHCEEQLQAADGSMVQRYTCDQPFDTSQSHQEIINSICLDMGSAICVDNTGLFSIIEGYDVSFAPMLSLTQDDVLSSGVWTPSPPARQRITRISGKYCDPAQDYATSSWGSIDVDPLADGIPRTQTTDFGGVNRAEACQRIAKQLLVRNKYSGTYTAVFGCKAAGAIVGDTVMLSGVQGWNNKTFTVVSSEETFSLTYQLVLREVSPEIWEWDASEAKPVPATLLVDDYDPIAAEDVLGLTIAAESIAGSNSVTTIVIDVAWLAAASLRTAAIEIQSQRVGDGATWTTEAERYDPRAGTFRFGAGVNGAAVNVRARFLMDNGAQGAWAAANLASTPASNVNNWDFAYSPGNYLPARNATNTRDPSTPIGGGGQTVGGLLTQVTSLQQASDAGSSGAQAAAQAASAAQHAAEQAEQAAQSARDDAQTYRDQARAAASDPNSVVATKVDELAAKVATNPNLLANGSFEGGAAGWQGGYLPSFGFTANAIYGTIAESATMTGTGSIESVPHPAVPGSQYTISGDAEHFPVQAGGSTSGSVYVDMVFLDASGNAVLDGPQAPRSDSFGFGSTPERFAATVTAPASAVSWQARCVWYGLSGQSVVGYRQIKVELGSRATLYSSDATTHDLSARITNTETAVSDGRFASAGRVSTLEAQLTGAQGSALQSSISTNDIASVHRDDALSNRITALSSSVTDPTTGLARTRADLSDEQTTRANADTALSDRLTTLDSSITDPGTGLARTRADLSAEQTARVTADTALANRTSSLESKTIVRPNLLANGSFEAGLRGWTGNTDRFTAYSNAVWGPIAYLIGAPLTGTYVLNSEQVSVGSGLPLTISGDIEFFNADGGGVYFDILCFDAAGNALLDGPQNASGQRGFSGDDSGPDFFKVSLVTPANTAYVVARCVGEGLVNCHNLGFRRIKLETGASRSIYTSDSTLQSFGSRITAAETAYSDGRFASADRTSTLEAQLAGNQGSNLLSRIQASEQAYSDGRFALASSLNTLSSTVGGVNATATAAYNTSVDNQNKLASARISLAAVAGDGRAQFTLSSDGHDGRWALVGDGQIDGNLTLNGSIRAAKFVTNAGVDLAAIVPGSISFRLSGNDGSNTRYYNNGATTVTCGTAYGTFTTAHQLTCSVSGYFAAGSPGAGQTIYLDLYYNNGGGWQYGANISSIYQQGNYDDGVSGALVQAGDWGYAQCALVVNCPDGGGAVQSLRLGLDAVAYK